MKLDGNDIAGISPICPYFHCTTLETVRTGSICASVVLSPQQPLGSHGNRRRVFALKLSTRTCTHR